MSGTKFLEICLIVCCLSSLALVCGIEPDEKNEEMVLIKPIMDAYVKGLGLPLNWSCAAKKVSISRHAGTMCTFVWGDKLLNVRCAKNGCYMLHSDYQLDGVDDD